MSRAIRRLDTPQTKIIWNRRGDFYAVYGWTQETVFETFTAPMMECIGIYDWRWTARLAEYRWLRKQRKQTP